MTRRGLIVLLVAFAVTRAVTGFLADHPEHYGPWDSKVTGDPGIYEGWSAQTLHQHLNPYSEVGIEYPPGAVPFIVLPGVEKPDGDTYRTRFILLMILVDLVGFLALLVLARRWGSALGPWIWVAVVPLLGPISYNRLDLLPAVATILALERLSARSWFGLGGWLGYGAIAKVYPVLFLPVAFLGTRRKQVLTGAAVVGGLFLVPHIGFLEDVYRNVVGYHTDRGIQIESLWGFVLLLSSKLGHPVVVNYSFGALHVDSSMASALEIVSQVLSLAVLGAAMWLAHGMAKRGPGGAPDAEAAGHEDVAGPVLAGVMFMTLAGAMAVGTVFSPQFMLWLGALGAGALCLRDSWLKVPGLALLPIAFLTQLVYPFFYGRVIGADPAALVLLASRNFLVLFVAVEAFLALRGVIAALPRREPAPEGAGSGRSV